MHVVVLVFGKPAAEYGIFLGVGELFVLLIQCIVLPVIDGIVRFHSRFPLRRIFLRYYRYRYIVDPVTEIFEMFVLDDPRVRDFPACIVHYGIALEVAALMQFFLKIYGPVFQVAETVIEIFVDFSGKHFFVRDGVPQFPVFTSVPSNSLSVSLL